MKKIQVLFFSLIAFSLNGYSEAKCRVHEKNVKMYESALISIENKIDDLNDIIFEKEKEFDKKNRTYARATTRSSKEVRKLPKEQIIKEAEKQALREGILNRGESLRSLRAVSSHHYNSKIFHQDLLDKCIEKQNNN
jgi:Fe-S cluster assembly scaffold protein SufB